MSKLLKAGLVSLLVASGTFNPDSTLCAADFSEFDELEADSADSVPEPTPVATSADDASDVSHEDVQLTDANAESDDANNDDPNDEFSSSSSRASAPRKKGKKKKKAAKRPKPAEVPKTESGESQREEPTLPDEPDSYVYEYIALSTVAAYITNFFIGKGANERRATAWANRYAKSLRKVFHQVGPLSGEDLEAVADEGEYCGMLLTKCSQNEFKLYATYVWFDSFTTKWRASVSSVFVDHALVILWL